MSNDNYVEFTVKCKMQERWAVPFIQMLKDMQIQGMMGHSYYSLFFSDGDGSYNPKFEFDPGIFETTGSYVAPSEKYTAINDALVRVVKYDYHYVP